MLAERSQAAGEARSALIVSGVQSCLDDNRGYDAVLPVAWDERAHKVDQLVGEEWVERAVVDVEWLAIEDLDGPEAGFLEVADEGTLRQGAGSRRLR